MGGGECWLQVPITSTPCPWHKGESLLWSESSADTDPEGVTSHTLNAQLWADSSYTKRLSLSSAGICKTGSVCSDRVHDPFLPTDTANTINITSDSVCLSSVLRDHQTVQSGAPNTWSRSVGSWEVAKIWAVWGSLKTGVSKTDLTVLY